MWVCGDTENQAAHTKNQSEELLENIVDQQLHSFYSILQPISQHPAAGCIQISIQTTVHRKVVTGSHMVMSISQPSTFKVTLKTKKKNTLSLMCAG